MERNIDRLLSKYPRDIAEEAVYYIESPDRLLGFFQDLLNQSSTDYLNYWRGNHRSLDPIKSSRYNLAETRLKSRLASVYLDYLPTLNYFSRIALDLPPNPAVVPDEHKVRVMLSTLGRTLPYSDDYFGQTAHSIVRDISLRQVADVHAENTQGRNPQFAAAYLNFRTRSPWEPFIRTRVRTAT